MIAQIREGTHLRPVRAPPSPEANAIPDSSLFRRAAGDMSRLAAAALRRGVTTSRDLSSSLLAVSPPVSARLFSADASGEAAATAAESQDDSFLKASREGSTAYILMPDWSLRFMQSINHRFMSKRDSAMAGRNDFLFLSP